MFTPNFDHRMMAHFNHPIAMRDGTLLRGDLYLPLGEDRHPVILMRTIFRKDHMSRGWGAYDPSYFVAHGYAVYIQDVRGLGQSEGVFTRFEADGSDGYDTIEALADEPWCTGDVGMFGSYYAGYLQLMAAAEQPPHLRAICPFQTHATLNRDNNNRGFLFSSHIGWCMAREINRLQDGRYPDDVTQKCLPLLLQYMKDYGSMATMRPLSAMPVLSLQELGVIAEYRKHVIYGYDDLDLIHREGRDMDFGRLLVPSMYCCSWYEGARNSLIEQCVAQRRHGSGASIHSEVIIGPWNQGQPMSIPDGALDFRKEEFCIQKELLRWFDKWLKHQTVEDPKPFRIYDVAVQRWVELDDYDDDGAAQSTLYLDAEYSANTSAVRGILVASPPVENGLPDVYQYDPDHPAPMAGIGMDCRAIEAREDILVYTSQPLAHSLSVCGLIRTRLFASSSAVDTDFMVRILDVSPSGAVMCISDGAVRAKYRDSWTPALLTPGEVYAFNIAAGHTVYTFLAGHCIRLEITSSCELRYDCNHNTGRRPEEDEDCSIATNSVFHTSAHPSCVILPLGKGGKPWD